MVRVLPFSISASESAGGSRPKCRPPAWPERVAKISLGYSQLSCNITEMPRNPAKLLEEMIWHDDNHLQIGDTNFLLAFDAPTLEATVPTAERFLLLKEKRLVQNLMKLFPEPIDNMIELGIFGGGSIALYEQLLSPARFVGVDIDRERVGALDEYLERHSATERVKLYYGTDQGDREALRKIARDNFNGQPLDLVIDDCSHRYEPCKASLNTLFPLLRPGGVYLIEDWSWAHGRDKYFEVFGGEKHPLSKLIFESVLVSATHSRIISEVIINTYQVALVRGPQAIEDGHFDVSEDYLTRWRMNFSPKLSVKSLWKTWAPLSVRKQVFNARGHLRKLLS